MGPKKGTIQREYSHVSENLEVPQYDIRLMRRLKRRSIASGIKEHTYSANAKRKNVGGCGDQVLKNAENDGHVLEEEVDEDYQFLLDKGVFKVDVVSNNNIIASDIDVSTSHDSDDGDDETDAQYKMFLGNLRKDDKSSYILEVFVDNQLFCVKYEEQEERLHDLVNSEIQCEGDEDYQLFLNSSWLDGDNLVYMPESAITIKYGESESEGKSSKVRKKLQVPFEVTELPKERQVSDVYHVDNHNNEVQCGTVDEDYQLFLNSSWMDGDCLISMPQRAVTIKYGGSESEGKSSKIRQNLQVPFEVTELSNSRQASDDYHVAKNKRPREVLSDLVDEDWQMYLNSEVRKNSEEKRPAVWQNLQASDHYCVAKKMHHNEMLSDAVDEDWQIDLNSEVRTNSEDKCSAVRQNLHISNEATELPSAGQASEDYHVAKKNSHSEVLSDVVDEDWQIYLNSEVWKNSEETHSAVRQNLQVSNEEAELPNAGHASEDYRVAENKQHNEVLSGDVDEDWEICLNSEVWKNSEETHLVVRQNLLVSNEATELLNARQDLGASHVTKHKCNSKELCNVMDEYYLLFLKSVSKDGDNLIYMPENGVTVVYGEECDQSSSDSELIILDPSHHYEDSPFIYPKSYYSSCLADERNHKDSLYRKGLMEELKRPYNQKELDELLQLVSHERPKEQHREMRRGVTKDRPKGGDDNKTSYLKTHGGLQNAISQVREPHKVLFLLRGFFYWLKHLPQGGAFRPWLDATCLKMLQKL